ncbi:hypothetical protein DI09_16p80 [Mitosporidium daphniae]|uniref:Uncharacterized protein n=1 Tax=Mitosporidium daphniae TaxID=1485682 RepID=A0A098VUF5_9MICR|nr:uncharacterized protein DI09_16p80 [Mitosporidium daphniae]KGG52454.1 hypothetical protein DI09_16p80 [Mitosporidium daphniae]|eukprot:XP_013238921.1 uncharacterized protein DI09_16p80 [Mitosporidium daphniae]
MNTIKQSFRSLSKRIGTVLEINDTPQTILPFPSQYSLSSKSWPPHELLALMLLQFLALVFLWNFLGSVGDYYGRQSSFHKNRHHGRQWLDNICRRLGMSCPSGRVSIQHLFRRIYAILLFFRVFELYLCLCWRDIFLWISPLLFGRYSDFSSFLAFSFWLYTGLEILQRKIDRILGFFCRNGVLLYRIELDLVFAYYLSESNHGWL